VSLAAYPKTTRTGGMRIKFFSVHLDLYYCLEISFMHCTGLVYALQRFLML